MAQIYGLTAAELERVNEAATLAQTVSAPAAGDVDAKARFPEESLKALAKAGFFGLWAITSFTPPGGSPRLLIGGEFTHVGTASPTKFFASFAVVP